MYEVFKAVRKENRRISIYITCMGTQLDDLESGYHVQVREVEYIWRRLPDMDRVTGWKLVELRSAILELRRVHEEQWMIVNEWNEDRYLHLKEKLEVIQDDISSLGKGNNGPSRGQTEVSPMDEISTIQHVEDVNLVQT